MGITKIESAEVIAQRSRKIIRDKRIEHWGEEGLGAIAEQLSTDLGRHVPKTTYSGYERNRNAPIDIKLMLCRYYNMPLWEISGLTANPDELLK